MHDPPRAPPAIVDGIQRGRVWRRLLWAFALTTTLAGLWSGSLYRWDEALTAERTREMLVVGDWLTPHFQYEPEFKKPPLYYWLSMPLFALFGPDEWCVRLVSALMALGCLAFAERAARRLGATPAAGAWALWLLASNPHWSNQVRQGLLDSGLTLGMVACLWLLTRRPARTGDPWLAGIALAGACLIKTPLALLILAPAAAGCAFADRRRGWWRRPLLAGGVATLLASFWFGAQVLHRGWAFVDQYFLYVHWGMLMTRPENPQSNPLFYLVRWAALAPFSLAALAAAVAWGIRDARQFRQSSAWWLALLTLLLGLSAVINKRATYLVLLFPFAAVVSGMMLDRALASLHSALARRALTTILVAVSLAFFLPHYLWKLDGGPAEKALGRAILKAEGPGRSVLTYQFPVNGILFYSQGRVYFADEGILDLELHRLAADGGKPLLLVAPKTESEAVRTAARKLVPNARLTVLRNEGRFRLFSIALPEIRPGVPAANRWP